MRGSGTESVIFISWVKEGKGLGTSNIPGWAVWLKGLCRLDVSLTLSCGPTTITKKDLKKSNIRDLFYILQYFILFLVSGKVNIVSADKETEFSTVAWSKLDVRNSIEYLKWSCSVLCVLDIEIYINDDYGIITIAVIILWYWQGRHVTECLLFQMVYGTILLLNVVLMIIIDWCRIIIINFISLIIIKKYFLPEIW